MMRAVRSAAPPGGKGEISRIWRLGQSPTSCAPMPCAKAGRASRNAAAASAPHRVAMPVSPRLDALRRRLGNARMQGQRRDDHVEQPRPWEAFLTEADRAVLAKGRF